MSDIPYVPMELQPTNELPEGKDWSYEVKLDGYRMLGRVATEGVRFVTKQGKNFTSRYPEAGRQLGLALGGHSAVVDGEMVGVDDQHKQSFAELNRRNPRVIYYVFDLLELDNEPVIDLTLRQRRRKLDKLFVQQPRVWLSPMFSERDIITNAAHAHDFEGVVAKRLSSKYQPGKRSRDWQKLRFADYPTGFSRR